MRNSTKRLNLLNWVFLLSSILHFSPAFSDPRITEAGLKCGNSTTTVSGNRIPNFTSVMRKISDNVTEQGWGYASLTNPPPETYALAQCHGDLSSTDCLLCSAASRTRIPRCLPNSGRLYLDGCFLRYDSYDFFNETVDPEHDMLNCSSSSVSSSTSGVLSDASLRNQFEDRVGRVLKNLTALAVKNKGFAVAEETHEANSSSGGIMGVYALAQCWSTLDENECRFCLENATSKAQTCVPSDEGRAMNAGCFVRYSTQKFYFVPVSGGSSSTGVKIAIAASVGAAVCLVLIGSYIKYRIVLKKNRGSRNPIKIPAFITKSKLMFKYEILEKATDFFDQTRKLGQGGAGSVYKGILPDGKVVAVKRLVFNTCQWADDFFNEVNLISGIQHKNLVKLLGCSIEGPESLLVYEYVPNRSLDQTLFAPDAARVLSWQERFHIITGTAEGLAYLHGGCGVKIIHRDIKTSNILLDEKLTAKIADFGLARCVAPDRSHITTGIAGTLGYMAPEYLVQGQLTEKADVYAFGVLVLEILSGRKNSAFVQGSVSLLQSVWRHYKSNSLVECMDPSLRGNFPIKVVSNVLQIGLLCTQASADLRPSMSEVVAMLNDKDGEIPTPKQPPFLNASVLSAGDTTRSSNTNTWITNQLTTSEASSNYTGSPRSNSQLTIEASDPR